MFGNPRDDGATGYDIGSMVFKVNYIGDGRFSVKADRYNEWIDIMNADLE